MAKLLNTQILGNLEVYSTPGAVGDITGYYSPEGLIDKDSKVLKVFDVNNETISYIKVINENIELNSSNININGINFFNNADGIITNNKNINAGSGIIYGGSLKIDYIEETIDGISTQKNGTLIDEGNITTIGDISGEIGLFTSLDAGSGGITSDGNIIATGKTVSAGTGLFTSLDAGAGGITSLGDIKIGVSGIFSSIIDGDNKEHFNLNNGVLILNKPSDINIDTITTGWDGTKQTLKVPGGLDASLKCSLNSSSELSIASDVNVYLSTNKDKEDVTKITDGNGDTHLYTISSGSYTLTMRNGNHDGALLSITPSGVLETGVFPNDGTKRIYNSYEYGNPKFNNLIINGPENSNGYIELNNKYEITKPLTLIDRHILTTMLNKNGENSAIENCDPEKFNNDYDNNILLTTNKPFQIHNDYNNDYNGIRFGTGNKPIASGQESNDSYINIYTGDDKDPIYVTQYKATTTDGENFYDDIANQIALLDKHGNTLLGDTVFFNKDLENIEGNKAIAIVDGGNDSIFGETGGIYLKNTGANNNAYINVDGEIFTAGHIHAKNHECKNNGVNIYHYVQNDNHLNNGGIIELNKSSLTNDTGDDIRTICLNGTNGNIDAVGKITSKAISSKTISVNSNTGTTSVIIKEDGDTLFFNPTNAPKIDTIAILNKKYKNDDPTKLEYDAGIYLRDTNTPIGENNAFMTVDGTVYAKNTIKTYYTDINAESNGNSIFGRIDIKDIHEENSKEISDVGTKITSGKISVKNKQYYGMDAKFTTDILGGAISFTYNGPTDSQNTDTDKDRKVNTDIRFFGIDTPDIKLYNHKINKTPNNYTIHLDGDNGNIDAAGISVGKYDSSKTIITDFDLTISSGGLPSTDDCTYYSSLNSNELAIYGEPDSYNQRKRTTINYSEIDLYSYSGKDKEEVLYINGVNRCVGSTQTLTLQSNNGNIDIFTAENDGSVILNDTVMKILNSDNNITIKLDTTGEITANTFNATSDIRLKENIVDFKPSKSILDLPIKEFDYIKSGVHAIGCIAQDLQEICPEIVNEDENGYLSIQESKIVYLLLDEVKKLRKELDELKGRE